MTTSDTPCEVPITEKLRSVPSDYRTCRAIQWSDDGRETGHQLIPVGYMMHEAADKLDLLERENNALREQVAEKEAALAVCVETIRRIISDTVLDKQDSDYYKRIMQVHVAWLRATTENLPESAKQVAKVIEAAKRVADGPFRQDYEELCQAMRDLDK